jgi:dipeptidase
MNKRFIGFFICVLMMTTALPGPAVQKAANHYTELEKAVESCTSVIVGRLASVDGSTMTSHSCDSTSDRTWINIVPHREHKPGDMCPVYFQPKRTKGPNDRPLKKGEIPQVAETYAFINTAYPCLNEHQLAIGETTFGGKRELRSSTGWFWKGPGPPGRPSVWPTS